LKALEHGCDNPECPDCKSIFELLDACDAYIPEPVRDTDKPFLMPVEDVFSISGRGTVATGRVERGVCKPGEEVEIIGFRPTVKTVATSIEMFRKILDQGQAGDNVGVLLRGIKKGRGRERSGPGQARVHHPPHQVQGRGLRPQQEEAAAYTLLHRVPSPVLLRTTDVTGVVKLPDGWRWSCPATTSPPM